MTPDGDGPAAVDARPLIELLRERREQFLAFVRWRSAARLAARRDPDDILQAAFISARRRWDDYGRSGMALEAWFYRVLLNTLLDDHDFQTRGRRDFRQELAWPDRSSVQFAAGLQAADTRPSEALARRELRERIERVLAALTPPHQEIMVLIHFAELTKEQAAELLGIDGGTARQRYARARLQFRETWKRLYGEDGFG
jgi:RNA polymerase sigma-70 factor (ECF subfamily)